MSDLLRPFNLDGRPLVVAVSGGVDSMVLLTQLVQEVAPAALIAAHFNHQLRPESDAEADLVSEYAHQLGVPFVTASWPQADHPTTGIEAAARQARYEFLAKVAGQYQAQAVLTAHHQDDEIETVLFRLVRSGNLAAMAGIQPKRQLTKDIELWRPFLNQSKSNLRQYAVAHHVPHVDDPSNNDVRYSRNLLRQQVLPLLKQINPQAGAHVNRFAAELTATLALAQQQIKRQLAAAQVDARTVDWRPFVDLPLATQALLLQAQLQQWVPTISAKQIDQILAGLNQSQRGNLTFDVGAGQKIAVSYHRLMLQDAPVSVPPVTVTMHNQWVSSGSQQIGLFTQLPDHAEPLAEVWAALPVTVRQRQPGDWLQLANGQHQKLARFMINHHWSQPARQGILVARGDQILGGAGIEPGQLFKPEQTDIMRSVLARLPEKFMNRGKENR
ncbi:tRNA lysidine(34) synthetase TilS [Lacticaseibacillus brantae]|uniref:tRNA(Ile)-lysidine synthase n=1 Tax=Lacticaseibacillus brantae DSM 23927 TaxID=1423727 RepID=A0A0R2B6H9_9LACO|nr:tRNA lysidine(34) synthetase TilS [Lacticaseibacillus brantae]KRM71235.1 tRNA(Ile)-lysidine synthetase, MesJ [Lacticaseibacillus brantae DSM 23927]